MILAVISDKGGSGKTTTAVHLAAYFQTLAPTLYLDADSTRSGSKWGKRGKGFPYRVAFDTDDDTGALIQQHTHTVIDTGQRQDLDDLRAAFAMCDQIVIPSAPTSLDVDGLSATINSLRTLGPDKFHVLLTKVARDAAKEAAELRGLLEGSNVPVLTAEIPYLKAFTKAAAAGQIVSETDDRNAGRAWEAYAAAGKELASWVI